jgi:hypothetical protein
MFPTRCCLQVCIPRVDQGGDIENLILLKEPANKTRIFWTLLKGKAISYFEHYLRKKLEAENSNLSDNVIELAIRELNISLEYIPKHTVQVQKYYIRQPRGLYMGINESVQQLVENVNDLNRYLLYFPKKFPKQLDQDKIIKILDHAKDPE